MKKPRPLEPQMIKEAPGGYPWLLLIVVALVLIAILGCADKRSDSADVIHQSNERPQSRAVRVEEVPIPDPALRAEVQDLKTQTQNSNQVVKNDIQGLGVQVAQVAQKLTGIEGDLLKVQTDIRTEIKNTLGPVSAQASAFDNMNIRLEKLAEANVMLAKNLEQTTQTVTAGRDSHIQTINFSREMVEVIRSENRVQFFSMLAFSLLSSVVTIAVVKVLTKRYG